jgi:hypothetical protein
VGFGKSFGVTGDRGERKTMATGRKTMVHRATDDGSPDLLALLICVAAGVAGAAAFANSLDGDFVFDETSAIVTNSDVTRTDTDGFDSAYFDDLLHHDFWGNPFDAQSHKSFRPLTVLTYRVNFLMDGLAVQGFHTGNVMLHSAACFLFAVMCVIWLGTSWGAAFAALLFAVHPVSKTASCSLWGLLLAMFVRTSRRANSL